MFHNDIHIEFTGYRGIPDEAAAMQAFVDAIGPDARWADLWIGDWEEGNISPIHNKATDAAVKAAWPNRTNQDPSYEGAIVVTQA